MRCTGAMLLASGVLLACSCGGGQSGAPAATGQTASGAQSRLGCAGFTADDAASYLGVPAAQVKANVQESSKGFWLCSFGTPANANAMSISVKIADTDKDAVEDMASYRSHLEVAGEQPQWKDLPKGAYSDIGGLGDEAVWTDISGSLTVRKGATTLQVMQPAGKLEQIKVAEAFLKTQ